MRRKNRDRAVNARFFKEYDEKLRPCNFRRENLPRVFTLAIFLYATSVSRR